MLPTLPITGKSLVLLFPKFSSLRAGDIVVYWSAQGSKWIIHRLKEYRTGFGWTVQGDNPETNAITDPEWVNEGNLLAVVLIPNLP